ncbi:MAG: hypothetical protein QOG03_678 [Actinomycetota bacterium]|jgi:hypothetical protein|nr:hypothetical protein [Actinomycetota bacterium]
MSFVGPIGRNRDGSFKLRLGPQERELLRTLPGQLLELFGSADPSLRRLFPPAYTDDAEREAEYQRFMADDLEARHRAALEILANTADNPRLDEEELTAWMGALNDLRLVLGTRIDVQEDMVDIDDDDPNAPALHLYGYLTYLQSEVIDALASGL